MDKVTKEHQLSKTVGIYDRKAKLYHLLQARLDLRCDVAGAKREKVRIEFIDRKVRPLDKIVVDKIVVEVQRKD